MCEQSKLENEVKQKQVTHTILMQISDSPPEGASIILPLGSLHVL